MIEETHIDERLTRQKLREISETSEKQLAGKIKQLLVKIRDSGTDPLGFGLRYAATHWNNNTEFEQWSAIMYPEMDFKIHVNVKIKYTGLIK